MKLRILGIALFGSSITLAGCAKKVDLCSLLTIAEVQQLDSSATGGAIERRVAFPSFSNAASPFCIWKDKSGADVLWLGNDLAPKDPLVGIAEAVSGPGARVEGIQGVGKDAAASFGANHHLIALFAHDGTYLIELQAPRVTDDQSQALATLNDFATKALKRMHD